MCAALCAAGLLQKTTCHPQAWWCYVHAYTQSWPASIAPVVQHCQHDHEVTLQCKCGCRFAALPTTQSSVFQLCDLSHAELQQMLHDPALAASCSETSGKLPQRPRMSHTLRMIQTALSTNLGRWSYSRAVGPVDAAAITFVMPVA